MSNDNQRSHAAHALGRGIGDTENIPSNQRPSYLLSSESDEMLELLEDLDDAIFTALQGSDDSLKAAKSLWPRALDQLDYELIEESREQYLRFAMEISRRFQASDLYYPERTVAAAEIIMLLTRDKH